MVDERFGPRWGILTVDLPDVVDLPMSIATFSDILQSWRPHKCAGQFLPLCHLDGSILAVCNVWIHVNNSSDGEVFDRIVDPNDGCRWTAR